jgi:prolyl-tRNA editing enzyme YbaK/EbsC (Cys-tRNA(Pro) deacylase)
MVPIESSQTLISSKIQELLSRVEELERKRFSKSSVFDDVIIVDESIRRARYAVETLTTHHYSAIWKFVPQNYYNISLDERAQCLRAPSIQYLCKSLLLENRKAPSSSSSSSSSINDQYDPTNPRFVLVIIQYASILDVKKLANAIRKLRTDVTQRLDETQFDFRIASESDNEVITGYSHNSVTPFGMLCQQQSNKRNDDNKYINEFNVPIILSSSLIPLNFLWMGGGHVHLKLGMSISDFCYALHPIIADISRPRTSLLNIEGQIDDDM